jgi:hypothetical protein
MRILRSTLVALGLVLVASVAHAQARLTVVNQSQRQMTVKVMKISINGESLLGITTVASLGMQTIYFSESGDYFLKTMAVLSGRDPVFQKGMPFRVYNGRDGYSVMTVTLSITESAVPQVLGGKEISKQEFDRDSSVR